MFCSHKNCAKAYVNDIVIFSKILKKHKKHLHAVFDLLNAKEMILSLKKFFIKYLIVTFLNQKIDAFDLIMIINKIDVIKRLDFPYTLTDLELYLRLTKYLRTYVLFYVQKTETLQRRKIVFLHTFSFNKNRLRKVYNQRTMINNFIDEELNLYRLLQKVFDKTFFLIHFNRDRVFYINVDASKRRDFDVMIYHLKFNINSKKLRVIDIELILFLSRLLSIAEFKY